MATVVSPEEKEKSYNSIMKLYDIAEEYIDVVEFGDLEHPEEYVPAVETIVHQIEESAEILAEAYIIFAETDKKPSRVEREKVEKAIAKIFFALDAFKKEEKRLH